MRIEIVKYKCTQCQKPEIFNITGILSANRHRLISKCFDNKICLSCHANNQIPETAQAIQKFLTGK